MGEATYMVFVSGMNAPQKEHSTQGEARAEAERLASMNPNRSVYVFEVVDVLEPVKSHRWRSAT